jgi:hypothetical protein
MRLAKENYPSPRKLPQVISYGLTFPSLFFLDFFHLRQNSCVVCRKQNHQSGNCHKSNTPRQRDVHLTAQKTALQSPSQHDKSSLPQYHTYSIESVAHTHI